MKDLWAFTKNCEIRVKQRSSANFTNHNWKVRHSQGDIQILRASRSLLRAHPHVMQPMRQYEKAKSRATLYSLSRTS